MEHDLDTLEAKSRAWRDDRNWYVESGMRLWKRAHLQTVFGRHKKLVFRDNPKAARREAERLDCQLMVWAGRRTPDHGDDVVSVEDGVVRSRGLGARLTPPLSLVRDDLGIYYDPTRESRLDRLIADACDIDEAARTRTERLVALLTKQGLTKYNTGSERMPELPEGRRILVVGQVEDDASVELGCPGARTNAALLQAARSAHPDAVIVYKPHPDVEAGLRKGAISDEDRTLADVVLREVSAHAALAAIDEVWTLTSTMGFEALLRGRPVNCLGMPFYAGWGLTTDHVEAPPWRLARPDLVALAYAALVAYPRYVDPITGLPCPPEVAIERLASGAEPQLSARHRLMAKLQGLRASVRLPRT